MPVESGLVFSLMTAAAVVIGLFLTMLFFLEVGLRVGRLHKGEEAGGALDGAVFGLMGLLVAFTFSGAASRFDHRRDLIVEEANDIGTAWLRLDLLAPADQPALREKFRAYVDARLALYAPRADVDLRLKEANALQNDIWKLAMAAGPRAPQPAGTMLLTPALNAMFDITSTRLAATRMHPPGIVYLLLVVVFLLCSLLGGYSMGGREHRSWLHILTFVAILTVTFYTIMDLEYPRLGLVQVTDFDQLLVSVRRSMD